MPPETISRMRLPIITARSDTATSAASQPPPGVDRGDPARQVADPHPSQAGLAHHACQFLLLRKCPNTFSKIAVTVRVPSDHAAQARQHLERPRVVDRP